MSQENVDAVRRGYEAFKATREIIRPEHTPGFVWDMSHFRGWPEQALYEGTEGARRFIRDWTGAWDDWELELDACHDAGDRVVAVVRQRGRSRATGMRLEMVFAQVWTFRDGRRTRMEMYADPAEAFEAVGLEK